MQITQNNNNYFSVCQSLIDEMSLFVDLIVEDEDQIENKFRGRDETR